MKKYAAGLLSVVFSMGLVAASQASPLLQIGLKDVSEVGVLPTDGSHDVAETVGTSGWYGADLFVADGVDVNLTFEYIGYEASWTNGFYVGEELAFTNRDFGTTTAATTGDTFVSSAAGGSALDFSFMVLAGGNLGADVANGANVAQSGVYSGIDSWGAANFFLGYADEDQSSVYIALDDGGGASINGDDDNHDDLVVKVTATRAQVPEPATMLLFGTGLVGLAGLGRRRSAKR